MKREILIELEHIRDAQLAELREKRAKEKQASTANSENQANVTDEFVEGKTENASEAVIDKEVVTNFLYFVKIKESNLCYVMCFTNNDKILQRGSESALQADAQLEYDSQRGQNQLYVAPSITTNEEGTQCNGLVL